MAKRRRKKRAARNYSQEVLLVLTGSALTLCALSVMYGFMIRKSIARSEVHGVCIEILNGTGQKGLARKAAASVRKTGIDVLQAENAESFSYEESILIGRKKGVALNPLGRALGCDNVVEELREDSVVDATLILGADYRTLKLGDMEDSTLLE
ncbi:MAG: LytR C-terminal domain-containing protein [Candidatus Krumholzibacteria bacterium]|nr:LytR C-terminal domain-containing protein [Candidatus Krumholzibacteria bacterium]